MPPVTLDKAVSASVTNALIDHVNAANGRSIFASVGTFAWQVPKGVTRFTVYLTAGGSVVSGNEYGLAAFDSPLVSKIFVDQIEGTTYQVIIGKGGNVNDGDGGIAHRSSFGNDALYSNPSGLLQDGAHNGELRHGNQMFIYSAPQGYGQTGLYGAPGICVIMW